MIEAVTQQAKNKHLKRVGLLASPNTIRSGLYRNALASVSISVLEPSESDIDLLDELIHEVIAGKDIGALRPKLTSIANTLIKDGADSILLGCTELPLIGVNVDAPTIDSLSALAIKMLERQASGK